jgi:flagellar protein FlaJ
VDEKYRKITMGVSAALFILCLFFIIFFKGYLPRPPFWVPVLQETNTLIGLSLLVSILPLASLNFVGDRWLESVDRNVPRLVQDVAEDVKSGQPLIVSLEENAEGNYGSLTTPLQNSLIRLKFTSDFTESMRWLGNKLRRPVAKQMAAIFVEAYEAGGRVTDILQNSVKLFKSIDENRVNRNTQTRPYVLVVYVSLGVFLIISWVILNRFLIPMSTNAQNITGNTYGFNLNLLDMDYYRSILFWSALTESLLGGLIAGKISKGKVSSGLIHSAIMMSLTLIFFSSIM